MVLDKAETGVTSREVYLRVNKVLEGEKTCARSEPCVGGINFFPHTHQSLARYDDP